MATMHQFWRPVIAALNSGNVTCHFSAQLLACWSPQRHTPCTTSSSHVVTKLRSRCARFGYSLCDSDRSPQYVTLCPYPVTRLFYATSRGQVLPASLDLTGYSDRCPARARTCHAQAARAECVAT